MYGYPDEIKKFHDFGLTANYVTYISADKSKGIFSRLFESLFCDNLYKILHYKCPQCGTEYESDPLLIVHKGEKCSMKKSEYPLIKDWKELSEIPNESNTHILEVDIDAGNAWLKAKNPKPYNPRKSYMRQVSYQDHYLSTHSFYGSNYKTASKLLHVCGFDVNLDNWDKD